MDEKIPAVKDSKWFQKLLAETCLKPRYKKGNIVNCQLAKKVSSEIIIISEFY